MFAENSKMLEMMNVVLDNRQAKEKSSRHFKRKREEKFKIKQANGAGKSEHSQNGGDDRPLVD